MALFVDDARCKSFNEKAAERNYIAIGFVTRFFVASNTFIFSEKKAPFPAPPLGLHTAFGRKERRV